MAYRTMKVKTEKIIFKRGKRNTFKIQEKLIDGSAQWVRGAISTGDWRIFDDVLVLIPAETTPDELIDVVMVALRVGQEAYGILCEQSKDASLIDRAGVDDFAGFGDGVGEIPIGHRVLAVAAVGDVGVAADWILLGDPST